MKKLLHQLSEAFAWVRDLASRTSVRHDRAPIDTVERVCHFARTRAALIAQKKLYGYLKERMGLQYPKVFSDDAFVASLNIGKAHIYAACLADMTCYSVAAATTEPVFDKAARERFARDCFRMGIEENAGGASEEDRRNWLEAFDERLEKTVWQGPGEGGRHFIESAPALVRWAPIADELKRYDREIVENSIRYAWVEVRGDYLQRLDRAGVAADWGKMPA